MKKKAYAKPASHPIGAEAGQPLLEGSVNSNVDLSGGDRDDDGTLEPAAKDYGDFASRHSVWE